MKNSCVLITTGVIQGGSSVFVLCAVIVALLDQGTKALVARSLAVHDSIPVLGSFFKLTHVRNPGAAFGILPNQRWLFITVSLGLIIAAIMYRHKIMREPRLVQIGLGLGLGGAIGNLIDRLRTGYVTDFIDVPLIPVFNLADTAIVCGVAFLLWASFFIKQPNEPFFAKEKGPDGA